MSVAFTAEDLGSPHKQAIVLLSGDIFFRDRGPKTRPTGSGIKLGIRAKELFTAAAATVGSFLVVVPILPGERWLRTFFSSDVKLFIRQFFLPLVVILFDLFHNLSPRVSLAPQTLSACSLHDNCFIQLCMLINWSGIGMLAARSI